jgi:hypothetical protein
MLTDKEIGDWVLSFKEFVDLKPHAEDAFFAYMIHFGKFGDFPINLVLHAPKYELNSVFCLFTFTLDGIHFDEIEPERKYDFQRKLLRFCSIHCLRLNLGLFLPPYVVSVCKPMEREVLTLFKLRENLDLMGITSSYFIAEFIHYFPELFSKKPNEIELQKSTIFI